MRRNQLITPIVVFLIGFALSMILDARQLVSSRILASPAGTEPQILSRGSQRQYWEYRVVSRDSSHKDLESELSRLGEQGFEVFSVSQTSKQTSTGFDLTIILRRLKY